MAPAGKSLDPKDLLMGGALQCAEGLSFGMPFEVWKTHMGMNRREGAMESFGNIYRRGGVGAFWKGWQPKMVECFLKGGLLLFAKDGIIRASKTAGLSDVTAGVLGGFGGGCAQVVVLGPCTYLITAKVSEVKGEASVSMTQRMVQTWQSQGLAGFYRGGTALMLRQGSNWASRQGLTDASRALIKSVNGGGGKLSVGEEFLAGTIGGGLSVWNQPFEVCRIVQQHASARGLPSTTMMQTMSMIVKENGAMGLFQGAGPRAGLCVVQTLFMVTIPTLIKEYKA